VEREDANSPQKRSPPHPSSIFADETTSGPDFDNRTQAFDYIEPRALYDDESPSLLTTYDEPVRRIIEDMREQRMSLCQSLRQYVFVHRTIIEGSLIIVDEEKAAVRKLKKAQLSGDNFHRGSRSPPRGPFVESRTGRTTPYTHKGKRNASPTELIREDKSGDLAMPKRPSLKWRRSSNLPEYSDVSSSSLPWPPNTVPSK